jgi:hypothetical protein
MSSNVYPDIEDLLTEIFDLDMLPIAVLRSNKTSLVPEHEDYISTKNLLLRLQLALADVLDNINSNSSIDDVADCFINFAVAPTDTHKVVSKLLYTQFYEIHVARDLLSVGQYSANVRMEDVQNSAVWTHVAWSPDQVGVLQDNDLADLQVGDYTHVVVEGVKGIPGFEGDGETDAYPATPAIPSELILQFQKTMSTYDQLKIFNLNTMAAIEYGNHHKVAVSTLGNEELTIPVSRFMFEQLTPKETMEVYQYILRIDFYAISIQDIEFYETSAFLGLFEFVMLVITIYTLDFKGGWLALAKQLALRYIMVELVVYVAEATGNEALAAIVGVVAAIVLSDGLGMSSLGDMSTAEAILKVSTDFANNMTLAYDVKLQQQGKELEEINKSFENMMELVDEDSNKNPIDVNFMLALQSVDTNIYKAKECLYNFDLTRDYDSLVQNFYDDRLRSGIV